MLYGRSTEQARLAELIAGAREGRSGALVLRGEPGIGKTALMDWAAGEAGAAGLRVLRLTGIEQETDLALAGLAQLLWPVQEHIGALTPPQAEALRAVLSSAPGGAAPDRFLTGLATLSLLADLAEEQPVLCLVDDAHWLDQASAEALLFAARRLAAEGVAVVFATREDGFAAAGLAEVRPSRLDATGAADLLTVHGLAPALREQVIAVSEGNPLALIEFAAAQRGSSTGPVHLAVAERVLGSFRAQIVNLPERTRLVLLIAAAEGRGNLPMLVKAGQIMDVGLDDLEAAERTGLVQVIDDRLSFRHPLIATAAYQGAPMARRIAAHRALAEVSPSADCRVHHLSAATTAPDENVAAELTAAAERARVRGAYGAAARLYRRAAHLSPDEGDRIANLDHAASASLTAGHPALAAELTEHAQGLAADGDPRLAGLAQVRAAALFELGERTRAVRLLMEQAGRADADRAAEMLRTGATYAWFSCEPEPVRAAARSLTDMGRPDPMVSGLAHLMDEDYAGALPHLTRFLTEASVDRGAEAMYSSMVVADDATTLELAAAEVARCRAHGLIGALPEALRVLAETQVRAGLHREAEMAVAEATEIVRVTGLPQDLTWLTVVPAKIAAIEGDAGRSRALAARLPESDTAHAAVTLSLLDLGLGDYEAALSRLETSWRGPGAHGIDLIAAAADQVEAAVRLGRPDRAVQPLRRFTAWAEATGQPWALAVAARSQALLTDTHQPSSEAAPAQATPHPEGTPTPGQTTPPSLPSGQTTSPSLPAGAPASGQPTRTEELFAQAVHLHQQGGRPFERARTELLYGEWLRRARRRSDARTPLRSALEIFERLRATPWAERARAELRATGESVVAAEATAAHPRDRLTAQELQVVRLAAEGHSSKEIAAQLFLSKRTVEHHLYKAYPKLGVGSRRELARLDLAGAG
ncbi:helix-turn-helix transcriptional regulator [Nonomuraea typhae]|uniref:helix-turn-helix transcriptional regulator n=1 Tax=Nonomuraea typhae TaxID=2603600 RepID=UPI0012F73A69|nr:helix-turn-helix transcriptional regulator [Nonomuraea typhae]